jgi:predicted metal-dependent hydrolase
MARSSLYPEQQLRRRVMAWAVELGVNPAQVDIRRLSDKWGSCAPDGVVTLAADLATVDAELQDYVIVHELLHLRHLGHGRVFRALLATNVPGWAEVERRLSELTPPRPLETSADIAAHG